jgi:hypothetical protein
VVVEGAHGTAAKIPFDDVISITVVAALKALEKVAARYTSIATGIKVQTLGEGPYRQLVSAALRFLVLYYYTDDDDSYDYNDYDDNYSEIHV